PEEVLNLEDAEEISENSRRLSILLVDDDAINRLAARTLLEQAGQMVIEAENGKVAIEKIKTQAFDVILMDIHMPVMDGILATKIIRQDENNQMPIIGLTASVMSDEKGGYLKAGMNAVVEKPVRIESLMKTIRNNL
ncbi:MAG: response regulator, partial [Gammaproteobacteria bacterium]|nr:response regulator [Gammaproteobacteria bacterium]